MERYKFKNNTNEYKLILGYIGIFLMLIGVVLITPILMTPIIHLIYHEKEYINIPYFLIPSSISLSLGVCLYMSFLKNRVGNLKKHQDIVLVILVWLIAIFIGTIPFLFIGKSFTKSLFEITSGFTTTGFEAFNLDELPKIFIFYRSVTNFFGGIGLVLILASAINIKHGMLFYKAEGHDGLMPSLVKSSKLLFSIYSYFILIGTCLYIIAGFNFFDALNHAISSIATGGFSTFNDSVASQNRSIQVVSIILMILGSTNFLIYVAIYKMKFKSIIKNSETIYSLFLYLAVLPIVVLILAIKYKVGFNKAYNEYGFLYISAQTTTGLSNVSNLLFIPDFLFIILLIRMIIGGQSGSTSAGIKQYRMVYIFKGMSIYLLNMFKNSRTISTNYIYVMGKKVIFSKDEYRKHLSFSFIYLLLVIFGGIALIIAMPYNVNNFDGNLIKQGIFNFAAALGNVGLSMTDLTKATNAELWIYIFAMFLGRLEILPVFIGAKRLFSDIFKRKKNKFVYSDKEI